jgi:hypothetical protein
MSIAVFWTNPVILLQAQRVNEYTESRAAERSRIAGYARVLAITCHISCARCPIRSRCPIRY